MTVNHYNELRSRSLGLTDPRPSLEGVTIPNAHVKGVALPIHSINRAGNVTATDLQGWPDRDRLSVRRANHD